MREILEELGLKSETAREVAERYGHRLGAVGEAELAEIPSLGRRDRRKILAAVELGKELLKKDDFGGSLRSSAEVYERFKHLGLQENESFWALSLNAKNRVMAAFKIADGTASQCMISTREVLVKLLREGALQCILIHNHPSGDPTPSSEDIEITGRFIAACKLVGITLLDHVIIGRGCFTSLRDTGRMTGQTVQTGGFEGVREAVMKPADTEQYMRQMDVLNMPLTADTHVTVIGAGAIGSFTALALAKMGIGGLTIYDHDIVETHNSPNQWFRLSDIGAPKVRALKEILRDFSGIDACVHERNFVAQPVSGIVVCAVDSMDARVKIWRHVKKQRGVSLYIDARMGAEVGRILAVRPNDPLSVRAYEEELYPSSEAFQAPCTAKATIYCAAGLASFIAAKVGKFIMGRPLRDSIVIDFRQAIII